MNVSIKSIRKLMGWCPNAKANEAKRQISLKNFGFNIPDRTRGDSVDTKSLGWLRKESTRILLTAIFTTSLYFLILRQLGINPIFFLSGFFIATVYFAFYWKTQIQRYDDLIKQPVIDHSNDKINILVKILFLLNIVIPFLGIIVGRELAWQAILSLYGGLLVFFWLSYFQIKYWEKINNKTIFFDKKYGRCKRSYIIIEKK